MNPNRTKDYFTKFGGEYIIYTPGDSVMRPSLVALQNSQCIYPIYENGFGERIFVYFYY